MEMVEKRSQAFREVAGAEAGLALMNLAARLKSCPVTKQLPGWTTKLLNS
jgi:hypothetical protein